MNFAIPYTRNFNYFDKNNYQFNINYRPNIKALDIFIEKYKEKRINFIISLEPTQEFTFEEQRDLNIIQILNEKYPNTKLITCFPYYLKHIENKLNEMNIPHYYSQQITNWTKLRGFLQLNVTDVFIAEELGFDLERVKKAAEEKNIKTRAYCNVAQSSWSDTPPLKKFFIRPADIKIYSKYIDTFEFFNPSKTSINTLYKIYSQKNFWFGPLNEIIQEYSGPQDERFLSKIFGEKRAKCKLQCIKTSKSCKICDRIVELSESFKNQGLVIMPPKKQVDIEEIKKELGEKNGG